MSHLRSHIRPHIRSHLSSMINKYGAEGYLFFWELVNSLSESSGMPGLVTRDSAASYIDTDGVLQIADGDESPFSHASIEDETGYTDIQGSFVDGSSWFDGVELGNELVLNGEDWTGATGSTLPTGWQRGNIALYTVLSDSGPGGAGDSTLKFEIDSQVNPQLNDAITTVIGVKYKFSGYYKHGNVFSANIRVGTSVGGTQYLSFASLTNPIWKKYTGYFTATTTTTYIYFNIISSTSGKYSLFDNFSIKEIQSSLADHAGTGNLLIIDDTAAKGYGYIGEVGGGEVATALANNVTGITKADPGVVSSVAHGLAIGDLVYFDSLTEMTELNGEYKNVTAVGSADLFSINDTSGYGVAESTGGACAHEVTEPGATAVKIYKDYELTTSGWNALDSGLDYNAGTDWEFDVYTNLMSSSGSTAQARFEANGLLSEGESTNWCLQSNDLTESAWSATNITPLKDIIGVNGEANSASRLTATAGNSTILQTINTLASATHTYSVWLKRITGTGNIDLTDNNGVNWTTKTLTTEWQRFFVSRSQTDPIVGIRIVTSGDVIAVQFNQMEASQAYITSAIPTTTIPVTRTADSHSWTMSTAFKNLMGDVADSPFTMVCEWTPKFAYGNTSGIEAIVSVKNDVDLFQIDENGNVLSGDGTGTSLVDNNYVANTTYLFALRVYDDAGTMKFEVGEKHGGVWTWDATPANYDGSFNPATNFLIGLLNQYPFNIKNIYFYKQKTQAWIEGKF